MLLTAPSASEHAGGGPRRDLPGVVSTRSVIVDNRLDLNAVAAATGGGGGNSAVGGPPHSHRLHHEPYSQQHQYYEHHQQSYSQEAYLSHPSLSASAVSSPVVTAPGTPSMFPWWPGAGPQGQGQQAQGQAHHHLHHGQNLGPYLLAHSYGHQQQHSTDSATSSSQRAYADRSQAYVNPPTPVHYTRDAYGYAVPASPTTSSSANMYTHHVVFQPGTFQQRTPPPPQPVYASQSRKYNPHLTHASSSYVDPSACGPRLAIEGPPSSSAANASYIPAIVDLLTAPASAGNPKYPSPPHPPPASAHSSLSIDCLRRPSNTYSTSSLNHDLQPPSSASLSNSNSPSYGETQQAGQGQAGAVVPQGQVQHVGAGSQGQSQGVQMQASGSSLTMYGSTSAFGYDASGSGTYGYRGAPMSGKKRSREEDVKCDYRAAPSLPNTVGSGTWNDPIEVLSVSPPRSARELVPNGEVEQQQDYQLKHPHHAPHPAPLQAFDYGVKQYQHSPTSAIAHDPTHSPNSTVYSPVFPPSGSGHAHLYSPYAYPAQLPPPSSYQLQQQQQRTTTTTTTTVSSARHFYVPTSSAAEYRNAPAQPNLCPPPMSRTPLRPQATSTTLAPSVTAGGGLPSYAAGPSLSICTSTAAMPPPASPHHHYYPHHPGHHHVGASPYQGPSHSQTPLTPVNSSFIAADEFPRSAAPGPPGRHQDFIFPPPALPHPAVPSPQQHHVPHPQSAQALQHQPVQIYAPAPQKQQAAAPAITPVQQMPAQQQQVVVQQAPPPRTPLRAAGAYESVIAQAPPSMNTRLQRKMALARQQEAAARQAAAATAAAAPAAPPYSNAAAQAYYQHAPPAPNLGKCTEVIDLTGSPDVEVRLLPAPASKRRKVAAGKRKDVATGYWEGQNAQQQPLPPSCDDAEGHYIVNVGEDLSARYKILRLLGQGTFGKVIEAYDRTKQQRVAIKIIRAVPKYRDASKVEIKVLQTLRKYDPENRKRCIHLVEVFDHRNHVCMVFELLAQSVFDFLKDGGFAPFPATQIQSFARQIIEAVQFLHELGLIHTDLKPENLMLERNECNNVPVRCAKNSAEAARVRRELLSTRIRLIDFGSAIFCNDYHSSVVSTRHYRAPEIILGLGWSYPCDMWSVGCILVEFFTGDALFQTHDNLEHLAMMEAVLGKFPDHMVRDCHPDKPGAKFFRNGQLDWPQPDTAKNSRKYVRNMQDLPNLIRPYDELTREFQDLVGRLLTFDPRQRITAQQALQHPFFRVGEGGRQER